MRRYTKISLLIFILTVLSACGNLAQQDANNIRQSDLWTWDVNNYYKEKIVGKVVVYGGKDLAKESKVSFANLKSINKEYYSGLINKNESNEITLLEGDYIFYVRTDLWKQKTIKVVGGETVYLLADGNDIVQTETIPNDILMRKRGAIASKNDFANLIKANISASYDLTGESLNKSVNVTVINSIIEPIFKLNNEFVQPESKKNNSYKLNVKLSKGDNNLIVEAMGADRKPVTKNFILHIKTDKEIQAEKLAAIEAERKRIEDERLKKIQLEKEAKAKKIEAERIAREGDGSPDDIDCKKYGLKPQTQGYAECRMRLDLSRKESERAQAINAANIRANENARKADLQRRYEEEQRQKQVIANRESKCQMLKAQEYLRPVMGGFVESMQNANSVYDNCMAGVPQINTSCSKDGLGNINCTSR